MLEGVRTAPLAVQIMFSLFVTGAVSVVYAVVSAPLMAMITSICTVPTAATVYATVTAIMVSPNPDTIKSL